MGFKLLILGDGEDDDWRVREWPPMLKEAAPDIDVTACRTVGEALEVIGDMDAAFGNIVPELFERGVNLKWVACPQAGPQAGWYHQGLIDSDVLVTNTRGIYNDYISSHIMAFVLSFAKGLHVYMPLQMRQEWNQVYDPIYLPDATAVVVGAGGIGAEAGRLCAEFGMTVLGGGPSGGASRLPGSQKCYHSRRGCSRRSGREILSSPRCRRHRTPRGCLGGSSSAL